MTHASDEEETSYFHSQEFKDNITAAINAVTWDIGLPKIVTKDGWIVEHWSDGTIVKLQPLDK